MTLQIDVHGPSRGRGKKNGVYDGAEREGYDNAYGRMAQEPRFCTKEREQIPYKQLLNIPTRASARNSRTDAKRKCHRNMLPLTQLLTTPPRKWCVMSGVSLGSKPSAPKCAKTLLPSFNIGRSCLRELRWCNKVYIYIYIKKNKIPVAQKIEARHPAFKPGQGMVWKILLQAKAQSFQSLHGGISVNAGSRCSNSHRIK